jgi:hypothetical protein
VLVGAVLVAVLLGISILRFGPSTPPLAGESARPATASRAEPAHTPPEPRAAVVPAVEEALPEVAPEPAVTDEGRRIGLERVPAEPVPAASDEAPEAQPVEVAERADVAAVVQAPPIREEVVTALVEEEAAATLTQPQVPEVAVVVETAAVEEEAAATVTQPEVAAVAEEEEVAVHTEAPPLHDEMATAAVQPDLAGSAEEEPAEPEPPALGSPVAAVSFPVQVNATPWATIEIDGRDFGETPLAGIPLPAGPHSFRARMPDGRVVERVVEIDAENRFVVFE